jgi:hypothetical protein
MGRYSERGGEEPDAERRFEQRLKRLAAESPAGSSESKPWRGQNARREARRAVFAAATFDQTGDAPVDAVVRNLSEGGAEVQFTRRLEFSASDLLLVAPVLRLRRLARIVWRTANAIGIKFTD